MPDVDGEVGYAPIVGLLYHVTKPIPYGKVVYVGTELEKGPNVTVTVVKVTVLRLLGWTDEEIIRNTGMTIGGCVMNTTFESRAAEVEVWSCDEGKPEKSAGETAVVPENVVGIPFLGISETEKAKEHDVPCTEEIVLSTNPPCTVRKEVGPVAKIVFRGGGSDVNPPRAKGPFLASAGAGTIDPYINCESSREKDPHDVGESAHCSPEVESYPVGELEVQPPGLGALAARRERVEMGSCCTQKKERTFWTPMEKENHGKFQRPPANERRRKNKKD